MRIIFAGSSDLSSKSVTLAAMMSRVREKMPMGKLRLDVVLRAYSWMGATGAKGELERLGRRLPVSGKIADNDWPLGVDVCIDLLIFLMVEDRDGVAREDCCH